LVDDGASSENSTAELLSGHRILLAKLILATGIWLCSKIPIEYEYRFTEYEYEFDALDTGDEREVPFFLLYLNAGMFWDVRRRKSSPTAGWRA
jgi:hypothetical protein